MLNTLFSSWNVSPTLPDALARLGNETWRSRVITACGVLSFSAATLLLTSTINAKDITLGAVQMVAEHEWFRTIELGMKAAAEKEGAKVLVGNARGQVDTEAQLVDNFVGRGVDAVIISALNPSSSVPALKRAVDDGVKLINYNTTIDSPIMTTFVGVDNSELGAQMGRYVADYVKNKMGGTAKIALIEIQKYEAGRQRRDGFVKEISQVPGISIVAEQEGELPDPAANVVETILQGHPETQLLWAANEGGLVGAITGAKPSAGKVKIFGTDMSLQVANALLNPGSGLLAVSTQDPYTIGYTSAELAIAKVKGEKTPAKVLVPLQMFTADNPDAVRAYIAKYQALAH
ncbi:MAG: substrate-binding domain-containing protein [Verrucomicrobia bacterium]|nr:substrate-binding domain-containing protein [Verrucomicrobiota bacterium]